MHLQMVGNPLFARLQFVGRGQQQGADDLALCQPLQGVRLAPPGNHGAGARASGALGGQNFGEHAALANAAACAACHGLQRRIARLAYVYQLSVWLFARVGSKQAALVGQDDQQISFDQVGHQCA